MVLVLPDRTSRHDSLPIPVLALEGATSYWAVAVANLPGHKSNLGAQGTKGCDGRSRQAGSPDQLTTWPTRRPGGYRGGQRRADLDPPGGGAGPAGSAAPALPVSLPARGGAAGLRGRPACQGAAEGRGARGAADRAGAGGTGGPDGRGGAGLLRRGAQCHHRRWPPAAGCLGAAAQGAAGGGGGQPGPGGGKGGVYREFCVWGGTMLLKEPSHAATQT